VDITPYLKEGVFAGITIYLIVFLVRDVKNTQTRMIDVLEKIWDAVRRK
jgi:formate-dependent nitrite reductase membrane component NrfD